MLLHAMDIIAQPGWGNYFQAWTAPFARALTGYNVGTDATLQFPEYDLSRLQQMIWVPTHLPAVHRGLLIFYAVLVIVGGDNLPNTADPGALFASSLAQNPAVVRLDDHRVLREVRPPRHRGRWAPSLN